MPVQAIVVDLWGIIFNIFYNRRRQILQNLGISDDRINRLLGSRVYKEFQCGKIDEEFFMSFANSLSISCRDEEFKQNWNCLLTNFEETKIEGRSAETCEAFLKFLIDQKTAGRKIYLLSNMDPWQFEKFEQILAQYPTIKELFRECFDKEFYSCHSSYRKPESLASFANVIETLPTEILFIDDTEGNTEAAKQAGWQTLLVPTNVPFSELQALIEEKLESKPIQSQSRCIVS